MMVAGHAHRIRRVSTKTVVLRPLILLSLFLLSLLVCNACGRGQHAQEPSAPVVVQPPPQDAVELARGLVDSKILALMSFDGLANHAAGARLVRKLSANFGFDGTGLDPVTDISNLFVAAAGLKDTDLFVAVVRYTVPQEQVTAALNTMILRSEPQGEWLSAPNTRAARVVVRSRERVFVMADPDMLVVLPAELAHRAGEFTGPLALPAPSGQETVQAIIEQPSKTLRVPGAPRVPETLSTAFVRVILRQDGCVDGGLEAQSASPEQAQTDAVVLTREIEDVTTVKGSFLRVRLLGPVVFRADEDRVKADVALRAGEISTVMAFIEMGLRR